MNVCERIRLQEERIAAACARAGRAQESVRLLAVSKTRDIADVRAAAHCGLRAFGENYVQELSTKAQQVPELQWHFIGRLQSNKVRRLLGHVALIHTVDRSSVLREINRRSDTPQPILVQVNVDGDPAKSGCRAADLPALVDECVDADMVQLRGFMTIPALGAVPEASRPVFRSLRRLLAVERERVAQTSTASADEMTELSMGMSADLEIAVEEGATIVRVGTAIFGERHA